MIDQSTDAKDEYITYLGIKNGGIGWFKDYTSYPKRGGWRTIILNRYSRNNENHSEQSYYYNQTRGKHSPTD